MKKIILPLLLLGMFSGRAGAQEKPGTRPAPQKAAAESPVRPSLEIGARLPMEGHPIESVNGTPTTLGRAKTENGLLVMFSCNTCPYVIKAQPKTREAMGVAKELGIGMVIVNSNQGQRNTEDSRLAMKAYAERQNYHVPYLIDEMSQMANMFGATRTPEVFLFDGEGNLVYKGALEDNPAEPEKSTKKYLENAMRALHAKKEITPAETKSVGCSIKRLHS